MMFSQDLMEARSDGQGLKHPSHDDTMEDCRIGIRLSCAWSYNSSWSARGHVAFMLFSNPFIKHAGWTESRRLLLVGSA